MSQKILTLLQISNKFNVLRGHKVKNTKELLALLEKHIVGK